MKARKLVAMVMLAMLPAVTAGIARARHDGVPRATGAQWVYAVDMQQTESLLFGIGAAVFCGVVTAGIGSIACGIDAAL